MYKSKKVVFNAPVVLGFVLVCVIAFVLNMITKGDSNIQLFSIYRSSLRHPLTYIRLFGHVAGHVDWEHLSGNVMLLLVLGTLLEEKYGSINILAVILITAVITGLVNFIIFPDVQLMGASGVVFAFILLASVGNAKEDTISVTFILVAVIYIGKEIYQGIFVSDNIANLTHIIGAFIGAGIGILMNRHQ